MHRFLGWFFSYVSKDCWSCKHWDRENRYNEYCSCGENPVVAWCRVQKWDSYEDNLCEYYQRRGLNEQ